MQSEASILVEHASNHRRFAHQVQDDFESLVSGPDAPAIQGAISTPILLVTRGLMFLKGYRV